MNQNNTKPIITTKEFFRGEVEMPKDFASQVKALIESKDSFNLGNFFYNLGKLLTKEFNNEESSKENDLLKELRKILTWDVSHHVSADLEVEVSDPYVPFESGEIDEDDLRQLINDGLELEQIVNEDLYDHVVGETEVCYSGNFSDPRGVIKVQGIALKEKVEDDPYIKFKESVFKILNYEDIGAVGEDHIIHSIQTGNPTELGRWLEQSITEWRNELRSES